MVPAARARPITAPNRPRPRQNFSPPLPPPPSPPSPPLPASASASASTLAAARPSSPLSPSPPLPLLPRERPCAPAWPHCTGCLCHLSKASARPLWPPRTGPLPPSLLSSLPLFKPKPARESARPRIGRDWCGPSLAMFYRKTVDLREPVFCRGRQAVVRRSVGRELSLRCPHPAQSPRSSVARSLEALACIAVEESSMPRWASSAQRRPNMCEASGRWTQ